MTGSYVLRHDFSNLHLLGPCTILAWVYRKILPNEWEKHVLNKKLIKKKTSQRAREYNWCWERAGDTSATALGT